MLQIESIFLCTTVVQSDKSGMYHIQQSLQSADCPQYSTYLMKKEELLVRVPVAQQI